MLAVTQCPLGLALPFVSQRYVRKYARTVATADGGPLMALASCLSSTSSSGVLGGAGGGGGCGDLASVLRWRRERTLTLKVPLRSSLGVGGGLGGGADSGGVGGCTLAPSGAVVFAFVHPAASQVNVSRWRSANTSSVARTSAGRFHAICISSIAALHFCGLLHSGVSR